MCDENQVTINFKNGKYLFSKILKFVHIPIDIILLNFISKIPQDPYFVFKRIIDQKSNVSDLKF